MNQHRRQENKRARRRTRLAKETPRQRKRREERNQAIVEAGSARALKMMDGAPNVELGPQPRIPGVVRGRRAPFHISMPCTCWPPRAHGSHWVPVAEDEADSLEEAA